MVNNNNDSLSEEVSGIEPPDENKRLIHRLNRIQGQLESIKRSLAKGAEKDCLETIHLIKATSQAIKKFGEAYMHVHVERCLNKQNSRDKMEEELKNVIHSVFTM